jgi:hypothetical protein
MKYIKPLLLLALTFTFCIEGYSTSSNQHKIDSLKNIISLKSDNLTQEKEGQILSSISKNYLQIGDLKKCKSLQLEISENISRIKRL